MAANEFDAFCRDAFGFLGLRARDISSSTASRRAAVHELFGIRLPFPSAEDLILFKVLAGRDKDMLDAAGVARRHRGRLDRDYLEQTLRPICELAEDMAPWSRLQRALAAARE